MDTFQENRTEEACCVSNGASQSVLQNEINISEEIEKYLNNLASKDVEFIDPKLKRERQRLQDLLTSYKKLSEQLDRKCAEASKVGIHVPTREILARRAEIYALLHPELYKNRRDEEKKKLIEKISSRRHFSEVDKVCPRDLTPIHSVSDKRQQEKDRFCKLMASAPSRFHNILGEPATRFKRLTRPSSVPQCPVDVRETEKDRLARIFATSAAFIRDPNLKKRILQSYKEKDIPSRLNTAACSTPPITHHEMVRIGEYSPLNKYTHPTQGRTVLGVGEHEELEKHLSEELRHECLNHQEQHEMVRNGQHTPLKKYSRPTQGLTVLGVGEHEEQEKHLSEERRYECLSHQEQHGMVRTGEHSPLNKYSRPTQGLTVLGVGEHEERGKQLSEERRFECLHHQEKQDKVDKGVMVSTPNGRRSVSSASTQTDELQPDAESPVRAYPSKMSPRQFVDISPREEKIKRIAYAQALQEQIKEKKRLEEERKQRERQEEEHEERRYKEQAERIKKEYDHERNLKLDFVVQRQAQEDLLRKRLADMNLEAKELKRKEQLGRLSNERDGSPEASVSYHYPNLASAHDDLPAHENDRRRLDRDLSGATSAAVLPEHLAEAGFDQDWSKITSLEGVDLLREHRSHKERLQLPPVVDHTTAIERRKTRSTKSPQADGYIPSNMNDRMRRTQNYKQQAEAILRAPLDEEIVPLNSTTQRSAVSLPPHQRSRSPVLPAVRTESMLRRNSRILDDKWKVPQESTHDLGRTIVDKENILTQLGAFRRQLAQEHHKLEERIRGQSSS